MNNNITLNYNNNFNYHTMEENCNLKIFTNKIIDKNIFVKGIMNKNKKLPPYINMAQTDKEICECLICFEEIDKEKPYIKCHTCNNFYHVRCANEWFFKKNNGEKNNCSYCQQKTLKTHYKSRSIFSCCFPWFCPKKPKTISCEENYF